MSLAKILLFVAVVAAIWFGWRWYQRWELAHRGQNRAGRKRESPRAVTAEEMVPCRVCGTYVPARGATTCARRDCPY
ncbi:MAG TPA: hypothetical protein VF342_03865 [Alphaproteobacteria bacterium]